MISVVFPVVRTPSYRTLGPIIEAAARDPRFEVSILLSPPMVTGIKAYQNPTRDTVPERLSGLVQVEEAASNSGMVERISEFDAVVSHIGRRIFLDALLLRDDKSNLHRMAVANIAKPLWCAVFETHHSILIDHAFWDADQTFWPSRYFLDWAIQEHAGFSGKLEKGAEIVGYVRAENANISSPGEIRREWGLDEHQPTVLFIPDGYRLKDRFAVTSWYTHLWCVANPGKRLLNSVIRLRQVTAIKDALTHQLNHDAVLRAVRTFCDHNNAHFLLARRRRKDCLTDEIFTPEELAVADTIIAEDQDYPQTLLRAMQVADLVISGTRSESVLDAAAVGVPYLTVGVPSRAFLKRTRDYNREFDRGRGHTPGVNWVVPAKDFVDEFSGRKLSEYALVPDALSTYRSTHIGPTDGKISERILAAIKKNLATSIPAHSAIS